MLVVVIYCADAPPHPQPLSPWERADFGNAPLQSFPLPGGEGQGEGIDGPHHD